MPISNFSNLQNYIVIEGTNFFSSFQFIEFGKTATEAESFSFLSKEIPVRLSNIMKEINLLPGNLLHMPSLLILQVCMQDS